MFFVHQILPVNITLFPSSSDITIIVKGALKNTIYLAVFSSFA